MPAVLVGLAQLPGVEVRQFDAASGRIVVVQEASDVGAEMESFMLIRTLPHVINADLVCHYFADEADPAPGVAPAHDLFQDPAQGAAWQPHA